jgi:hypothetical protein
MSSAAATFSVSSEKKKTELNIELSSVERKIEKLRSMIKYELSCSSMFSSERENLEMSIMMQYTTAHCSIL